MLLLFNESLFTFHNLILGKYQFKLVLKINRFKIYCSQFEEEIFRSQKNCDKIANNVWP